MKKRGSALLACFVLAVLLLPCLTQTAHAADLDEIVSYDVAAIPSETDGSLNITVTVDWKVLDQGPVSWVKIGIPNGNVENAQGMTASVKSLTNDSSYMYVYFDRDYQDGETIHFSYQWTQTYMYTLNGNQVSYAYTPGWFDEAKVDHMTLTWVSPVTGGSVSAAVKGAGSYQESTSGNGYTMTAEQLSHGGSITLSASYPSWPTALTGDMSAENVPQESGQNDDTFSAIAGIATMVIVLVVIMSLTAVIRRDRWAGGFGTRYVFVNGLYYPRGTDGQPRPGSVGTPPRPAPPPGGFGSGRGGGFGGGGFGGGGGHCACASSCACACACACAGGGRAGCSAKNLYGAIHLPASKEEPANQ